MVFAFSVCGTIFAQEAEVVANNEEKSDVIKLSLEDAVDYALKNSRTLKSNDIDLEMKKRASSNSWNVFLPNVTVSGTMARANEYNPSGLASTMAIAKFHPEVLANGIKTDFDKEEERWNTVGTVNASWAFSVKMIAAIKKAQLDYEGGKITWEKSQKETILSIKKLYYGLVLQQENLKIQKATLENARQRYFQAQTNFKNGLVPEIMLLQNQVNYENTKPTVESAEQEFYQTLDTLAFLIGYPVGTKLELTSEIEPVYVDADTEVLLSKYGNNDLNMKSLQNNIDLIKTNKSLLGASTWLPALSVSYGWIPAYIGSEGAWHFTGDIGKDEAWYDSGKLSLTLAWNITDMLPWSSNRQQIKDLNQNLAKLELTMETLKENQKVEVRKAVNTLNQAKQQIDAMGRTVQVAQKAYEMQAKSYRNGTTELLDLRDSEKSYNEAKLGLLSKKMTYISALLDLENTLNTTLTK
ncbi:MAG: TolC family protein [Treponema sp.]|nr:TolC family protein [Candidatus Treponema equifaecale]